MVTGEGIIIWKVHQRKGTVQCPCLICFCRENLKSVPLFILYTSPAHQLECWKCWGINGIITHVQLQGWDMTWACQDDSQTLRVCLFAQFQWGGSGKCFTKQNEKGVHFSIWPFCVLGHWVCAWLLGTVCRLRLCSFSGRDALFTQWAKCSPPAFIPQNVQCPASGVMPDTIQLCSFLQRGREHHDPLLSETRMVSFSEHLFVYFACLTMYKLLPTTLFLRWRALQPVPGLLWGWDITGF